MNAYFTSTGVWAIVGAAIIVSGMVLFVIWIAWKETWEKRMKKTVYNTKMKIRKYIKAVKTVMPFIKVIRNSSGTYTQEILFESFVQFYENIYQEAEESWAFDAEAFPRGIDDLTNMYRWIKKIRHDNYAELANLEWDEKHNWIKYWGGRYHNLKHKVDHDGLLHITPLTDVDIPGMEMRLMRLRLAIENTLYDLDTEKATWIISRRKHLML
jgi:hypothetical protein